MRHVARQVRSPTSTPILAVVSVPFLFSVVAVGHRQWCHIRLEYRQRTGHPRSGLSKEAWHWDEPQGPTGTTRCPVAPLTSLVLVCMSVMFVRLMPVTRPRATVTLSILAYCSLFQFDTIFKWISPFNVIRSVWLLRQNKHVFIWTVAERVRPTMMIQTNTKYHKRV